MTFQLMVVHHITKFGYKHSADWEQIFVMSITSLTPEDITVPSLL